MGLLTRLAAAFLYLGGTPAQLGRVDPERLARAGAALMLTGVLWGLFMVGVWDLTFRLTWGALLNWVVPAIACAAATTLLTYRHAFTALIETAHLPRRWLKWPALALLTAAWAAMLNHAVRHWDPDWPTQHVHPALIWLWPRALYRVLLLAPVWGSWSMLVLPKFHRPDGRTDPHTRSLCTTTSPLAAAAWLALPLAGSFIYLMFVPRPFRFVPPAAAVLVALGAGALTVRIRGRLCREALLATNVLTQAAFVAAYVAVR